MNRLQRWYFDWARHSYRKLPPTGRAQAEAIDRFLYSRRGLGIWLGVLLAVAAASIGLHANGAAWWAAVALSVLGVFALAFFMILGWVMPERFPARVVWRMALLMVVVTLAGKMGTLFTHGELDGRSGAAWLEAALAALWGAAPFQLLAGLAMMLLVWVTSSARRESLKRELAQSRAEQERDAAAAQLTQARLHLLQAQIQPHFLFNTLAALQHWVDMGDARAAPLLRSFTSFLRGSTELMLCPEVTLAQEIVLVRHYLAIMQARLGERLIWRIDVAPDCEAQALPPGLLITLVENAVQHGIEPQLRGGEVQVIARCGAEGGFELHVLDDGAGLPPADATAGDHRPGGVGLANSRERLRHQFGARAELVLGPRTGSPGTDVCLRLAGDKPPVGG